MEDVYVRYMPECFSYTDTIIFLDLPWYLCIWRVIKRTIFNWGKSIPGTLQTANNIFLL